jgi:gas vesicle protein
MYERRGGSPFGAFLLGGLIGAVLALLFAPRTGQETREMLTDRANEYWGQAGDMYNTGVEKVGEVVDTGAVTATEKSEQLRGKIDEARARLQEQVAKSADMAKDKINDATPAVKDAVDKAAEGTKTGVDFAAGKAHEGLDFVAKNLVPGEEMADDEEAVGEGTPLTANAADASGSSKPEN